MKKYFLILITLTLIFMAVVGFIFGRRWYCNSLLEKAEIALADEKYQQAEIIYNHVLQINPEDPRALNHLGKLFYRNRNYKKSLAYFERAAATSWNRADNYYYRGMVYNKLKKPDKAIKALREALSIDPEMDNARKELAIAFYQNKQTDEAISLLRKIIKKNSQDPDPYILLFSYLREKKENDQARQVLEKALQLKQPPRIVFLNLLVYYEKEQNQDKIYKLLKNYVEKYKTDLASYLAVSSYYEQKKKYDKAEAILMEALKNLPKNITLYILLSEFYIRQKRFNDALKAVNMAISIDPNSELAYSNLGMIYYEMGKLQESETELLRSLAIRKKQPVTLNMLAWLYLTAPPGSSLYKPEEALSLARKAVALEPESSAYIDTLARALYANNSYEEAVVHYRSNVNRDKNLDYAYYGLSLCLYKMGDLKQASTMLNLAKQQGFKDVKLMAHDREIPLLKDARWVQDMLARERK